MFSVALMAQLPERAHCTKALSSPQQPGFESSALLHVIPSHFPLFLSLSSSTIK